MVANGVISITASIMESSDIDSPDKPENTQESFFEKMKGWVKGLAKNWKGMVKKGATAGFYALLASSKIMQGVTKAMFGIVGSLIDILLAPLIPFISKGIEWLADIVRAVGDFIKNMPETFKKIWEPIWDYIMGVSRKAGDKILSIFESKGAEVSTDGTYRDELVAQTIGSDKGPIVSDTEKDAFLDGSATDHAILVDEPITQDDVDEFAANYREQFPNISEDEMEEIQTSYAEALEFPDGYDPRGPKTWMEEGGPAHPEGGPIGPYHAERAIHTKTIVLAEDSEILDGEEEMDKWYDSWKDEIPEFNLQEFFDEIWPDDWDPVGAITGLFTDSKKIQGKDVMTSLVDTVIDGVPVSQLDQTFISAGGGKAPSGSSQTAYDGGVSFIEQMLLQQYAASKKAK